MNKMNRDYVDLDYQNVKNGTSKHCDSVSSANRKHMGISDNSWTVNSKAECRTYQR